MIFQILNLMLKKTKFSDLARCSNLLLNNLEMLKRIVLLSSGQSSLMHTEVGTRAFQAPEMFEKDARTGKPNYRSSVDIFAMGLVFLAMLQTTGGENLVQKSELLF